LGDLTDDSTRRDPYVRCVADTPALDGSDAPESAVEPDGGAESEGEAGLISRMWKDGSPPPPPEAPEPG
jgi:hypothetical protein